MELSAVRDVLDALDRAGVRHGVAGGWGVDALVGRVTREHRDLDLLVDADQLEDSLSVLGALGYVVETDWLPIRVELAGHAGWVDVHPVRYDASGHGVQAGPEGTQYEYPAGIWTHGRLDGRAVRCLSAEHQVVVHTGYPPRPQDLADLALLDELLRG